MHFNYWRVFSHKLMRFWKFVYKGVALKQYENILDAFQNIILIQ